MWLLIGLGGWAFLSLAAAFFMGRVFSVLKLDRKESALPLAVASEVPRSRGGASPLGKRVLIVDDDSRLRLLLRTTLGADEYTVEEASSAEDAQRIVDVWRPRLVVLDVGLPGRGGLAFCRDLRGRADAPAVILLTGGETTLEEATSVGAVSLLRKPFSPLELVNLIDALLEDRLVAVQETAATSSEQLVTYARDLAQLLKTERAERRVLQQAYRQTMTALADALEARHRPTGLHALRVQRLAVELTRTVNPQLLGQPSLEYGFLLHDIGKIGIPDAILDKPGPLDSGELWLMQQHPLIGVQILTGVTLVEGNGISVVRSHHERWDGDGYPDGLAGERIPIGARIFAIVDALDAMTDERPYREALSWQQAVNEIRSHAGSQFDPHLVAQFLACEERLQRITAGTRLRVA